MDIILDKVYYHELAHAFMDAGYTPYDTPWGRIIEESLANGIAVSRFAGLEKALVMKLVKDQPAEYQGFLYFERALLQTISTSHLLPFLGLPMLVAPNSVFAQSDVIERLKKFREFSLKWKLCKRELRFPPHISLRIQP